MTAIKKTTSKSAKSPAPATKPTTAKSTRKKTAAAASPVTPAARAATQPPVSVVPPTPLAAAGSVPTIKTIATKPVVTKITARIDIGFGNTLYLRGEGAGLSWDSGVAMSCVAGDHWELVLPEATRPLVFKFLVNDLTWNAGADYTLAPGEQVTFTPEF